MHCNVVFLPSILRSCFEFPSRPSHVSSHLILIPTLMNGPVSLSFHLIFVPGYITSPRLLSVFIVTPLDSAEFVFFWTEQFESAPSRPVLKLTKLENSRLLSDPTGNPALSRRELGTRNATAIVRALSLYNYRLPPTSIASTNVTHGISLPKPARATSRPLRNPPRAILFSNIV